MRLVVNAHPRDWPGDVYRAAALVETLDARRRADAQETADELEELLATLKRRGVTAWLTS
ncbi:MAG: hypothetical protein AB1689_26685 [Thermodesulfobacteriota bacterium]